jgi:tetratricopeptide (TPR) repeat protein
MQWDIPTYSHLLDKAKNKGHCSHLRRRCIFIFGIISALLVFNGCATVSTNKWYQDAGGIPPKHELNAVPFYPQKEYQCGPASLAMTLAWSGLQIDPDDLTPQVYTPSLKGSLPPAMVAATRRHGRVAYPVSGANALLKEIAAGHPVIVLQNLGFSWIPLWHYAVVIGYDLNEGVITLHSGTTNQKKTSLRAFENTWARSDYWGLAILPPYRLPASADEFAYVSAIVGLEKARQWDAAAQGYQTALHHWPRNLSAHIGLSNSLYAKGELKTAEKVLRKTTDLFPNEGVVFNNLAQVLWEQGKKQEAIKTARQAVTLGGPFVEQYQKTLDEIQENEPYISD